MNLFGSIHAARACCEKKKTTQNVDCQRQFTLNKVPQQQNKTPNVLQLLSWCSVM
jgi:hypothetical protein